MLFNSADFIFAFLPVVLVGYFALARFHDGLLAKFWLTVSCLVFYGWWDASLVWVICVSVIFNFAIASLLSNDNIRNGAARGACLVLGIAGNLGLIGYFKYSGFLLEITNDIGGSDYDITQLILPLGISFFTFQQIAFLVDSWGGAVRRQKLLDYFLFVTFFPQLIAGPIVHHKEMMPQFARRPRFFHTDFSIGVTFFVFGLFKKVVLADGLSAYAIPVFDMASYGNDVGMLDAWGGALAYTFQLYFDISGYADMAVGLGRMFGICLPLNFNSPLKAKSIIEFWQRWHLTLTRFFTAYCYNPVTLGVTRRRMRLGQPGFRSKGGGTIGAFLTLLAFPLLLTMVLAGVWHGAGYQFFLFGLCHGVYLVVNHAWRTMKHRIVLPFGRLKWISGVSSMAMTFAAVVAAFVLFRADSVAAAVVIFKGMLGLNGMELRMSYYYAMGPAGDLFKSLGVLFTDEATLLFQGKVQAMWLIGTMLIVWFLPNSQEVIGDRYLNGAGAIRAGNEDGTRYYRNVGPVARWAGWHPNVFWGLVAAGAAFVVIDKLTATSEFLYFQF